MNELITNEVSIAKEKKTRKRRLFPTMSFQECYEFAKVIYDMGVGQKVRRISVFNKLQKSPESGSSRALISACNKYGLISGNTQTDYLELTENGKQATNDDLENTVQLKAKFVLAIQGIEIYKSLYEKFSNSKLPTHSVISDLSKDIEPELEKEELDSVVDTFIVNLKYLGLLRTISGAERIITIEHALEELTVTQVKKINQTNNNTVDLVENTTNQQIQLNDSFDNICFYITPIGEDNSEHRKHSDLFLESIVEPALKPLGLIVKRADHIDKPGTITKQVIEYIFKSKVVVADLSYHNPNVFYELALRHAFRLPTVQIIRKADGIPFDLHQTRTIIIDTTDIYCLVPKIETYRSEIANQVRQALNDPDAVDNPVTNVFPKLQMKTS
jgi:hypothetical protein